MNLNAYALSGICIMLSSAVIGTVVYLFGRDKYAGRVFGILNLFIFNWGFGSFKIAMATTPESALTWWRISYISVIWMPVLFFHFVCLFLKISRRIVLALSYSLASIFTLALAYKNAEYMFGSIELLFNQFYWNRDPQPLHIALFVIIFFGLVMYCMILMIKGMGRVDSLRKTQIKYFLVGSAIAWVGGELQFLPTFRILDVYPCFNFLLPLYPVIMGYAMIRHQLMDIEVIIKKTLVFAGLFTAVYAVFAGFAFLGQVVFEQLTGGNRWISIIPSIAAKILILRPLENFLIQITDRYLFQKKYDYKELLKTFTSEVLTVLDIEKLVHLTVEKLAGIIKTHSCGILLLNPDTNKYELAASVGIRSRQRSFSLDNTLVTFLGRTKLYLSIKDQGRDSRLPDRILHDMNELKLEMAIPLIIHDKMIGILTLGKKKSDEDYTQDDMDILLPLARTLSIAISNAEMFDELGRTQAEAAQREKMAVIGTLAAGINHEICNPLGIARGQCEVFLLNSEEGLYNNRSKEEQIFEAKKIMEKVIKETDRATAITKKLSSFAKPGKGDLNEKVDIGHEIDEVLALIGHELKLENINFVKQIPLDLPHVKGDRKQIQEILFNLIRNAGQAIEENGKITTRAHESDGRVVIEIEDTGHGIPENRLAQIFNPFYTTKAPGKGTGLGLFIVRQVVQRNKGTISVTSKVGQGTTFTLTFPVMQAVAA